MPPKKKKKQPAAASPTAKSPGKRRGRPPKAAEAEVPEAQEAVEAAAPPAPATETTTDSAPPPPAAEVGSGRAMNELVQVVVTEDTDTRNLLEEESNLILECKACRSLFRNIGNFSNHKRQFCSVLVPVPGMANKGVKRRGPSQASPPTGAKSRRVPAKKTTDKLTKALEDAMIAMGEGGEEDDEEDDVYGEGSGAGSSQRYQQPQKGRRTAPQKPAVQRPIKKFLASEPKSAKRTSAHSEQMPAETTKCRHCNKIFMNRAGCVSHERYCANITMKPMLGRGLAFHDDFGSDGPKVEQMQMASSPGTPTAVRRFAGEGSSTTPDSPSRPVMTIPKGAVLRRVTGEGGVPQTFIVTTINGVQRAIPVRPATGPPSPGMAGASPGRTFVKVAVPVGKPGSSLVVVPATPSQKPTAVVKPSEQVTATPGNSAAPTHHGPQAPIPNYLQPDLVKLLKEFSTVSGTVFFSMPELIKLSGDRESGPRLKELISVLPAAGLIASKPISSGVLTKIVLSRPADEEPGALKVVVIESGYSSQGRVRSVPRPPEPHRMPEPGDDDYDDEAEPSEDVKAVGTLFDEHRGEEEEEMDDEERLKQSQMLLPPPKPTLRKLELKMDKLLHSATTMRRGRMRAAAREGEGDGEEDEEAGRAGEETEEEELSEDVEEAVQKIQRKSEPEVTFKEMFAIPESERDDDEPDEYMTKQAKIIGSGADDKSAEEEGQSSSGFRKSAFSRKK